MAASRAVGVDVSPVQLDAARERWGGLPGLELHQRGALDFMSETTERFDAVHSAFGAIWFTDPDQMLPAIRQVLKPGGVLAFSQRPPPRRLEDRHAPCPGAGTRRLIPAPERAPCPPPGWAARSRIL
ncbi:class I SAM-dependent methyltransferase [Streptomyces sp. NPDC026206]|uniref:class I SAM-dependent methyltransferase n=1 Tax=Streptomyces sp. NPDC026206 TaxID=3157089 RepID=UPI0033EFDA91